MQNGIVEIDGKTINDIERSQDWPPVWEGSAACRLSRTSFFINEKMNKLFTTYDINNFIGYEISRQ